MAGDTDGDNHMDDDLTRHSSATSSENVTTLVESNNTLQRVTSNNESNNGLQSKATRNRRFDREWQPFRDNRAVQLNDDEVGGPLWFMNPTRAKYTYLGSAELIADGEGAERPLNEDGRHSAHHHSQSSHIHYQWTSRNNRKGRHALVIEQNEEHSGTPPPTGNLRSVLRGVWRMVTVFAFWDISYLLAVIFTLAVVILLANAGLAITPYTIPSWTPPAYLYIVEGVLTVVGCSLFFLSSLLGFLEASNSNRGGCIGWIREHIAPHEAEESNVEHGSTTRMVPDQTCAHRSHNVGNLFRTTKKRWANALAHSEAADSEQDPDQWRWFPTTYELWKDFIYDLGFVTSTILLLSSAVYCRAGIAALSSILMTGGDVAQWIRYPQLVAGIGFGVSSILFMLETQTRWIVPEFRVMGWWVGFWNLLGSAGFTICAAFALAGTEPKDEWAEYQFALSYMWATVFFTVGSGIQWYEALDKHPVQVMRKEWRDEK